eukprot:12425585-Prorocentrum_lima.AAC.1
MTELPLKTAAIISRARGIVSIATSLSEVRAAACDSDAAEVCVAALHACNAMQKTRWRASANW